MNLYVAGKTHDFARVREVQDAIKAMGHRITYDWTQNLKLDDKDQFESLTPEEEQEFAGKDVEGVRQASIIVAVSNEAWCGTLIEIGIALDRGVPIWILGPHVHRHSIFFRMGQFHRLDTIEEMQEALASLPT